MRRINHRQHDIDRLGDRFPLLPDLERATYCGNEAEDVGSGANAELGETRAGSLQEFRKHLRLAATVLFRKNLGWQTLVRLGEPDVVELDLAEAHFDRFFSNA